MRTFLIFDGKCLKEHLVITDHEIRSPSGRQTNWQHEAVNIINNYRMRFFCDIQNNQGQCRV